MHYNDKIKEILEMPLFNAREKFHISIRDYMDLTIKRMRVIFQSGLVNNDMWLGQTKQIQFNELCQSLSLWGTFDFSLGISLCEHLIAGNVLFTQSDASQMDKYRDEVIQLQRIYSFCCTEIASGTNLRNIKTTVTYDHTQRRLFLHSPTAESCKFWIGHALYSATIGMVLARLIVNGCDEGLHWFRVPLRNKENGPLFPGIYAISCEPRGGLHGNQIAGVRFDQVSLPLDAMMQRYSTISSQGLYHSQLSKSRRFTKLFETFLQERIFPLILVSGASSVALYITFKFSQHRAISLEPIYQALITEILFRQRLYPELLKALALDILSNVIIRKFQHDWGNKNTHKELQVLVAVGKFVGSSLGLDILRKCRAMCGSQGFHHYNQIITLQNDYEANITFAGDNSVMSYQIAKYMIRRNRFKEQTTIPANRAQQIEKKVVSGCLQHRFTDTEAQILSYAYALDLITQEIQKTNILDSEMLQELQNNFTHYFSDENYGNSTEPSIEKITKIINLIIPPLELITAPIVNADYAEQFTADLYNE
ncbi:hypothetical protein [Yersinia wautersii]|uniref:Acyl-CoA oxidase C-alpha1 domain-containing protein n=1 Tax=Yersinia wautersii TaxID=1341643 RepID=A0ABM9TJA4_9GAMM|nr:hypothetical protein [Yersinia wautersii]CRG51837.1 Uncharacterised protein [Yersinia wautersii]